MNQCNLKQNKEKEPNSPKPEKNGPGNIPKPNNPSSSTNNKDNQNYGLEKTKAAAIAEINLVLTVGSSEQCAIVQVFPNRQIARRRLDCITDHGGIGGEACFRIGRPSPR